MNALAITKTVVKTIVGLGASTITKQIIEKNVDTETAYQKVTVNSASIAIGFAASDAASEYTDRKIEEIAAWYIKNIKNRKTPTE